MAIATHKQFLREITAWSTCHNKAMQGQERLSNVLRRYFVAAIGVIFALVLAYILYQLKTVIVIFFIAALLAYVMEPPITWLSKRWNRLLATWVVFFLFFGLLGGVLALTIPTTVRQLQDFAQHVPDFIATWQLRIDNWRIHISPEMELVPGAYFTELATILEGGIPALVNNMVAQSPSFLASAGTVLVVILLVPIITLYMLLDSQRIKRAFLLCFVPRIRDDVDRAVRAINKSLGGYIFSRVVLALFVSITSVLVLFAFGVDYALVFGIVAFVLDFIPYLGPWLAFLPVALLLLVTNPWILLWVGICYLVIQAIEGYVIAPKLMGYQMDLHPLTVIGAMMIGGTLAGMGGLVVAIPIAAGIKIVLNMFVFKRAEPGIEVPELKWTKAQKDNAASGAD